jgi:Fe2+ transport system protein FeoA
MVYAKLAGLIHLHRKKTKKIEGAVPLTCVANGINVKVVELAAGQSAAQKLTDMGIFPGAVISKYAASFVHGPVVITKGSTQVAIGYNMAQKVMVETSCGCNDA